MHSHHSHSGQFCKHAKGSLEQVVQEAIEQGFSVYGLSEHVPRYRTQDLYPEEKDLSVDNLLETFDDYIKEAHRLRTLYAPNITLLVGLETDWISSLDADGLRKLLGRHGPKIEYIVGSIHHVNEIPIDFDQDTFSQAVASLSPTSSLEPLLSVYFDAQYALLATFHPEIIGHFDLCLLYHPTVLLSAFPDVWTKVQRNIAFAVEYGALFEVNAAAFRKGWTQAYPGLEIAQLIVKSGGRFALSDDSHGPHAVGLNYDRLLAYLRNDLALEDLWYLERCDERNIGGRMVRTQKVTGEWWAVDFWARGHEIEA